MPPARTLDNILLMRQRPHQIYENRASYSSMIPSGSIPCRPYVSSIRLSTAKDPAKAFLPTLVAQPSNQPHDQDGQIHSQKCVS